MTTDQVREALANLLRYAERNECTHEETRRAGFIWTICDGCGRKWADDEGGFQPYKEPAEIEAARAALAALSAATEGDAPPPTDERVQLLERLLGHEAGLICAWAKEPATHEAKLKAWAEVLERRVPDTPPPEPKPDATGGEAEDCCLTCGATLQEEQRDYCSPECAPPPEAAADAVVNRNRAAVGLGPIVRDLDYWRRNYEAAERDCTEAREQVRTATAELERVRLDFRVRGTLIDTLNEEIAALRAKLKEAERERDAREKEVREVIEVAERHGWNGVENSKILRVFIDNALTDAADAERRIAEAVARIRRGGMLDRMVADVERILTPAGTEVEG